MVMIMNGTMAGMATMSGSSLFRRSSELGKSFVSLCILFFIAFLLPVQAPESYAAVKKPSSLCKVEHPSDSKVEWECRRIRSGEKVEELFGEHWQDLLRFNRIDRRHADLGISLKVPRRFEDIKDFNPLPLVYPQAEKEPKFILVDQSEGFLGAYEYGRLVFSFPVATGEKGHKTPSGEFRIDAFERDHASTLYKIEKTRIAYPMHYALRFLVSRKGISFWIHGRDIPGYPASHGCIGLYDEEMQKKYYRYPRNPILNAARTLFEWAIAPNPGDGGFHRLKDGPRVVITGKAPAI